MGAENAFGGIRPPGLKISAAPKKTFTYFISPHTTLTSRPMEEPHSYSTDVTTKRDIWAWGRTGGQAGGPSKRQKGEAQIRTRIPKPNRAFKKENQRRRGFCWCSCVSHPFARPGWEILEPLSPKPKARTMNSHRTQKRSAPRTPLGPRPNDPRCTPRTSPGRPKGGQIFEKGLPGAPLPFWPFPGCQGPLWGPKRRDHTISPLPASSVLPERLLACVCNTNECLHEGTTTCHTKAHCYSQRWDQRDDSQPVVRGCMTAGSLLCMNQRPRGHNGSWPFLNCCDTYMCNRDVSPTLPSPALTLARRQDVNAESPPNSLERLGVSSVEEFRKKYDQTGPECDQSKLTMLYLGVTGAALILMVIITVVGSFILLSYRKKYIRAPCDPPEAPRVKSHHVPLFLQTNA
ncbi:uncharacterized protein LOC119585998 [Penaeus monodon]|uniref:uncharacterized protein LOC119585998 n=1 Tax=Penaeus monodon TaxID=6687 RepID=UPI0018A77E7F|nr:uncharacterized protein LOC119585998 [Penaeus monodon]